MQYMFLIYLDDTRFEPLSEGERRSYGNAMLDYDEELQASGHYVISEPLQPTSAAVTLPWISAWVRNPFSILRTFSASIP